MPIVPRVMEENKTPGQIIGDLVNAPYLNSLAKGGVSLGSMFGITHPSQPNYLELFSGSNQGMIDDESAIGPCEWNGRIHQDAPGRSGP